MNFKTTLSSMITTNNVNPNVVGAYTIDYSVTDTAGLTTMVSRTVNVEDTTPPDITLNGPAAITLEAAVDSYTEQDAIAIDLVDGQVTVTIGGDIVDVNVPGVYVVTYDAVDAAAVPNNAVQVTRTVTVEDTTEPVVTPPSDITVETTTGAGIVVNYPPATATDNVGVTIGPTCAPVSGSIFSIGGTIVTCTAEDASGNIGMATFTVTVEEKTYCNDMTIPELISSGIYTIFDNRGGPKTPLIGTSGPDLMMQGDNGGTVSGREGDDCLIGGPEGDLMVGGDDNDMIFGRDGNDLIDGGNGQDIIHGGNGIDSIFGSGGVDTIYGEQGNDSLHGGAGDDMIFGGDDDDFISGEQGNDTLNGEDGNDSITGHNGDDIINGGMGDDYVWGGLDIDTISGGPGDDTLLKGAGATDTIDGGDGVDICNANSGFESNCEI